MRQFTLSISMELDTRESEITWNQYLFITQTHTTHCTLIYVLRTTGIGGSILPLSGRNTNTLFGKYAMEESDDVWLKSPKFPRRGGLTRSFPNHNNPFHKQMLVKGVIMIGETANRQTCSRVQLKRDGTR
jgi:hypothetical protein